MDLFLTHIFDHEIDLVLSFLRQGVSSLSNQNFNPSYVNAECFHSDLGFKDTDCVASGLLNQPLRYFMNLTFCILYPSFNPEQLKDT